MASWGYEGGSSVTLTATPQGPNARAILGGGCSVTGSTGTAAECVLTLDQNQTVTVTFECQDGESCPR
jgi:hypothetical protein